MAQDKMEKRKSGHREDFIELLFPVSIGVGFAEHVARVVLHEGYVSTTAHQLIWSKVTGGSGLEIVLLVISMLAVILSWNWYIPRIRRYGLDYIRFTLDIVIVTMYLLLLLSSWLYELWFISLALIWWLYLAWDLALRKYSSDHRVRREPGSKIFMGVVWAGILTLLAIFNHPFSLTGAICASLCAAAVVIFYRADQAANWPLLGKLSAALTCCIILVFGVVRG